MVMAEAAQDIHPALVYIALGSNLGDRLGQMQRALDGLAAHPQLRIRRVSPVFENRAVGMGEAMPFFNAVAEVSSTLAPLEMLDLCQAIEADLGRVRSGDWAPRTIDLDLVAYGEREVAHERLQLPHPRMHERDFVMHPLAALAPDLSIRGEKVREIAARLPAEGLRQLPAGLQTPREA